VVSGRAAVDAAEVRLVKPRDPRSRSIVSLSQFPPINHIATAGDGYTDFGVMLADGGEEKIAAGSFSFVQRKTLRGGNGAIGC
jgi:hypothetical protein